MLEYKLILESSVLQYMKSGELQEMYEGRDIDKSVICGKSWKMFVFWSKTLVIFMKKDKAKWLWTYDQRGSHYRGITAI